MILGGVEGQPHNNEASKAIVYCALPEQRLQAIKRRTKHTANWLFTASSHESPPLCMRELPPLWRKAWPWPGKSSAPIARGPSPARATADDSHFDAKFAWYRRTWIRVIMYMCCFLCGVAMNISYDTHATCTQVSGKGLVQTRPVEQAGKGRTCVRMPRPFRPIPPEKLP